MMDLPPTLPEPYNAPPALVVACADRAARHFNLPAPVVYALIEVEGGKVGTISRNTNDTYDIGIMQINSIHLPELRARFSIGWEDLAYKPCVNIGIGTWILAREVRRAPDFWSGVGNYHSKTPKYHNRYLKKVVAAYRRLLTRPRNHLADR